MVERLLAQLHLALRFHQIDITAAVGRWLGPFCAVSMHAGVRIFLGVTLMSLTAVAIAFVLFGLLWVVIDPLTCLCIELRQDLEV